MKFTPKQLNENVNVSKIHPLIELCWLVGGLLLIAALLFLSLSVLTDWAVSNTPIKVENWLGGKALHQFPAKQHPALQQRLQQLLASLPDDSPLLQYDFRVFLSQTDEINAVALPGGNIVLFSGLLEQLESENELAMILAHELGHFAHRDHLRGLGRGLGLAVASVLLLGKDSAASSVVANALLTFQVRYSQAQESAADQFGLELLVARYGHAGGSSDFFRRMAKTAGSSIPYLLASHPHPDARVKQLEQWIQANNYPNASTQPLALELQNSTEP